MSVLVATAYMQEAEAFDWLVAMNDGRVVATGSPEGLRRRTGAAGVEAAFTPCCRRDAPPSRAPVPPRPPPCATGRSSPPAT